MAAKAMRLMRSEGISLKDAWAQVKAGKVGKRSRRGSRRGKRSRRSKRSRRGSRRSRRSKRFGIAGPGYKGQTSYQNAYSPYFGNSEPFVAASEWWAPQAGGVPQYPGLAKYPGLNKGPGN